MKYIKIALKIIKIGTIIVPVLKGIVLGIIKEYKDNIQQIKDIWNNK